MSDKKPALIIGDGNFGRPNDGLPFTGWTRVKAKGWGGTSTSVMRFVDKGIVNDTGFNTATDGTPFSMGGWDFYKKFWTETPKTIIKAAKGVKKAIDPLMESYGKAIIAKNEAEVEASNFVVEQGAKQILNLPNLPARLTPSNIEGQSVHDVNVKNEKLKDIRKLYGGE